MSNDVSVFSVRSSLDIHDSSLLIGNKGIFFVSPELPPSWSCRSASNVVSLHIKWVRLPVVVVNGLGDWIEEPLLGSNILSPLLQPDIVGTVAFSNSLHWHFGSNVEWPINMPSEFLADSLGFNFGCFINIYDVPSLVTTTMILMDYDWLSFLIFATWNVKNSVVLNVDQLVVLISENLPPSRIGTPDLHSVCSSWAHYVKWLIV